MRALSDLFHNSSQPMILISQAKENLPTTIKVHKKNSPLIIIKRTTLICTKINRIHEILAQIANIGWFIQEYRCIGKLTRGREINKNTHGSNKQILANLSKLQIHDRLLVSIYAWWTWTSQAQNSDNLVHIWLKNMHHSSTFWS